MVPIQKLQNIQIYSIQVTEVNDSIFYIKNVIYELLGTVLTAVISISYRLRTLGKPKKEVASPVIKQFLHPGETRLRPSFVYIVFVQLFD